MQQHQEQQHQEQYLSFLQSAAQYFKLTISQQKFDLLLAYHQLFIKWNKAYNLTSVRDPLEMVHRHLVDSMSVAPYLRIGELNTSDQQQKRFIDVGTGGGLPGIVLAILFPQCQFDLLDSNGKKTRFLFQVKTELKLANVMIHQCRVEKYQPETLYDGVLSRAFATLEDMVKGSSQLLADKGHFYAMKGIYPSEELSPLEKTYKVDACHKLDVPNSDGERHLVIMSKQP
ncbi:MAG: 16S rRNA (guanine527-N7)-methyltransferase [Pseudohongiellaceae bacterium]|jgi:16S rRNA (guanine527-N7)-methyltransferase